jgi:hypothetical protein
MFQSYTVTSGNRFTFNLEFLTRALLYMPEMITGAPEGIKKTSLDSIPTIKGETKYQ